MYGMLINWPEIAWRDFAERVGYLPSRMPAPPVDRKSDLGNLLSQHGFVARERVTGRSVLFADAVQVPQIELTRIEEQYGLQIGQYPSHRDPALCRLFEFRIVDSTRAKALFQTRAHAGPVRAERPSIFISTSKRK